MLKEFIKKNMLVSVVALGLTIIGTNAKADFFRWYLADDIAHNGDGRTLCFEINAYSQVLRGGNPVSDVYCGFKPELGTYREVPDLFGLVQCYEYNSVGAIMNNGGAVSQSFCYDTVRIERDRQAREWREREERARIQREVVRERLERERLARERMERERLERERLARERREREDRERGHHEERGGRHFSSNDAAVEDNGGIKDVTPMDVDGAPGSQDKASKEIAG